MWSRIKKDTIDCQLNSVALLRFIDELIYLNVSNAIKYCDTKYRKCLFMSLHYLADRKVVMLLLTVLHAVIGSSVSGWLISICFATCHPCKSGAIHVFFYMYHDMYHYLVSSIIYHIRIDNTLKPQLFKYV